MLLFNGVDLENYITIDNYPEIEEYPSVINNSLSIPSRDGEIYTGKKYGTKKIIINFFIDTRKTHDYRDRIRQIKNILNIREECKLILPEELDKYYWSTVESFTLEDICQDIGRGSVEFICFDPYCYSDELTVFEGDDNKIVNVNNNGSCTTYPLINVAFTKDCHFAQLTNWEGKSILVGNRPDIENESSNPNNVIISDNCESTADWLPAGNVVDGDRVVDGSVTISDNGNYITSNHFGSAVDGISWHGAAIRRNLDNNLTDFELRATMIYKDKFGATDGNPGGTPGGTTTGNYKVTCSALNMRSGAGTSYKVISTIPKNTKLNIIKFSNNKSWGQCTYKNKTGWVSMTYLSKVTTKYIGDVKKSVNNDKEENKMGRCELYGFDKNGQKLFKIVLRDSTYWYQYTEPEVFIGNTLVLDDKKNCPKPKTKTEKDGDKTVTKNIESGKFGDFNNFYGDFIIRRETINKKQYWYIEISKLSGGKVVKSIKTPNKLSNTSYPSTDLNHVVLWFGQHKELPVPDEIGLTHLKVSRIDDIPIENNVLNFSEGDELEIDCSENKIRLNGFECMEKLDIGSQFFGCDSGDTQFVCNTDDDEAYVSAIVQEKWI